MDHPEHGVNDEDKCRRDTRLHLYTKTAFVAVLNEKLCSIKMHGIHSNKIINGPQAKIIYNYKDTKRQIVSVIKYT
jgi:hypothetical protein